MLFLLSCVHASVCPIIPTSSLNLLLEEGNKLFSLCLIFQEPVLGYHIFFPLKKYQWVALEKSNRKSNLQFSSGFLIL